MELDLSISLLCAKVKLPLRYATPLSDGWRSVTATESRTLLLTILSNQRNWFMISRAMFTFSPPSIIGLQEEKSVEKNAHNIVSIFKFFCFKLLLFT